MAYLSIHKRILNRNILLNILYCTILFNLLAFMSNIQNLVCSLALSKKTLYENRNYICSYYKLKYKPIYIY